MSDRSYLSASNLASPYPSFAQEDYDPKSQTISTAVESIPVVWIAMFREADIRRESFEVEGEKIPIEAPLVERLKAIQQLDAALPYFNKMFQREGKFDEHFALMKQALQAIDYQYVSIELQEIALMFDDEQWFYDEFRQALRLIGARQGPDDHERILGISEMRGQERIPPARMYLDKIEFTPEDQWNFSRILGLGVHGSFGWGRPVPWETEDADYSFAFMAMEDEDDDEYEDEQYDDEEDDSPPAQK